VTSASESRRSFCLLPAPAQCKAPKLLQLQETSLGTIRVQRGRRLKQGIAMEKSNAEKCGPASSIPVKSYALDSVQGKSQGRRTTEFNLGREYYIRICGQPWKETNGFFSFSCNC